MDQQWNLNHKELKDLGTMMIQTHQRQSITELLMP
jgi:hypothetical protein